MVEINEMELIKFMGCFYVINMFLICGLYLYTIYTQYKNAHDKWYDIIRENDTDNERVTECGLKED